MVRVLRSVWLTVLLAVPAVGAVIGEPKNPYVDRPDDVPREHVVDVSTARREYTIPFAGTVDGAMTRSPIGYAAFSQGWQPNRAVLIENTGDTDVRNPWLVANGRGDWRTLAAIVAEATRGWTSEADKARAIWEFIRRHRFHACTWDKECSDAVKALNVYGYTLCGDQALVLNDLWKAAGLTTRRGYPVGHCVGEVFYDGGFHLLDSDEHVICLLRDNQTIASEDAVVRDHDLMKRTHTYGIGSGESRRTDEFSASLYGYEGKRDGEFAPSTQHTMDLVLRPGESLERRWDHVGKQYTAGQAPAPGQALRDGLGDLLSGWGRTAYDNLRNGRLCYRPDLRAESAARGAAAGENVTWDRTTARLQPTATDKPAQVTWRFASPYVFVGAQARATIQRHGEAVAQWRYSTDGKQWTTVAGPAGAAGGAPAAGQPASAGCEVARSRIRENSGAFRQGQRPPQPPNSHEFSYSPSKCATSKPAGAIPPPAAPTGDAGSADTIALVANADELVSPRTHPTYAFFWQLHLEGQVAVSDVAFTSDVQTSTLGLPELTVGENRLVYTDESPGARRVRITHRWRERSAWHPPAAPAAAVAPPDGAAVEGTRVRFAWDAARDPDGDAIADYHFELSAHPDLRWPLSPNFEKRTALTPSQGKAEWTTPYLGLLNPDTTYYWRVRALDATGVWGPWSKTFSFQCRAPGVPLDVQLAPDEQGGLTLAWQPNPQGRAPVAYKVYGSDEQGFSVSDTVYAVFRGKGFVRSFEEYAAKADNGPDTNLVQTPANLLATTSATLLRVVGPDLREPNANKAFYRVVAVDSEGNESGPSDYAAVPRPFVFTQPPPAQVGVRYEYQPGVIRSLGDLRCRANKASSYNAAFWDREEWAVEPVQLPEKLSFDLRSGLIKGRFTAAGDVSLTFKVTAPGGLETTVTQTVRVAR